MKTRSVLQAGTFTLLALASGACTEGADLVLRGGQVYTLTWDDPAPDGTPAADAPFADGRWSPDASAVAIADGEIVFVGSNDGVTDFIDGDTEVIELNGATVIPGLVDSHAHVIELGTNLNRVDLVGVGTPEEAIERVVARAEETPEGEWVLGAGWDEGAWANNYPTLEQLTDAVPDHPVWLRGLHGFAGWGNQRAFDAAGITRTTEDPVGGEILRHANGNASGILLNRAVNILDEIVPAPTAEQLERYAAQALSTMAESGYVMIHEAGTKADGMAAFEALEAKGGLPIRVYAMLSGRDPELLRKWEAKGPDTDTESMLRTRSVKAYYDAALGSRGARLLEDYSDMPGHRGISGEDYAFDVTSIEAMAAAGFQLGVHAIGDAGNRETLDILEGFFERHPGIGANRHRIEHAQLVHPDDFVRFGALELIASMEPPHAVEDMGWAEERVGAERIKGAYAWRSMREAGAGLIFNADLPGSDWSPFYGLHAAVTRRNKELQPQGGWHMEQAVTIEEAIRAYTSWAAHAAFVEGRTGKIEVGRWGDLTVVDIDPFAVATSDASGLLNGRIVATVVSGEVVYRP